MQRKKHLAPILCALSLVLLALNPLSNKKDKALNLKFDNIWGNAASQPTEDDPREGGLLRYKFFVKEKETLDNPALLKKQNQVLAKYEIKESEP